ncbi:Six-hairpin glycosidases superfamily protein [Perilla frutescens var. hirtella]|uniref:Endoglucanase n=1 Tax=Perilla frutescens var. hirtella TaxID=608512 RepID=A0AAD4J1G5_PERFH|nr:Six-hairpin glycosidases superfamily protein [Perilla frutescens var. hirtella]
MADLGCIECNRATFKWTSLSILIAFIVIGQFPITIAKFIPKHDPPRPLPDNYAVALHKALLFFNAQKSGKLPKNNGIPWRGDSGLQDGSDLTDVKGGLVGGYYDAGDNIKFHFPMSFAMTMLSWSVIEYKHKYRAIGEYDHVRNIIKWGTDYLLRTFNSSATQIDKIYSQVGGSQIGSTTPDDHYCWERPEDMDYPRIVQATTAGPDLVGEMAAAMAAASIVFRDNPAYSKKLRKGAKTVFAFARDSGRRTRYSRGNPFIEPYYNSTGYYDEYMWAATWLFYATGNISYFALATNPGIGKNSRAFNMSPDFSVLSWDNKLPAAMLLLTRTRLFLNPGYPYDDILKYYHNATGLTMCSYLRRYNVFNWTRGGMIQLNRGRAQNLQYTANAAFLASVFSDYLNAMGVPIWYCGRGTFSPLRANPSKMSYVVGYGSKYPKQVHHRGASIPRGKTKYSCTGGRRWRDAKTPNPNTITGAMVGGPYPFDNFKDVRSNYSYTEPTLAGNAGLVAALVSLTASGGVGVDKNSIFAAVPPLYPTTTPPPPWKP